MWSLLTFTHTLSLSLTGALSHTLTQSLTSSHSVLSHLCILVDNFFPIVKMEISLQIVLY